MRILPVQIGKKWLAHYHLMRILWAKKRGNRIDQKVFSIIGVGMNCIHRRMVINNRYIENCFSCCNCRKSKQQRARRQQHKSNGYKITAQSDETEPDYAKTTSVQHAVRGIGNQSMFISRRFGFDLSTLTDSNKMDKNDQQEDELIFVPSLIPENESYHDKSIPTSIQMINKSNTLGLEDDENIFSLNPHKSASISNSSQWSKRSICDGLTPLELRASMCEFDYTESNGAIVVSPPPMRRILSCPTSDVENIKLTKNQIEHRILQILERLYEEEYEEGNIELDTYMILEDAIDKALNSEHANDHTPLIILEREISSAFQINPFIKWLYDKWKCGLTQYLLLGQLSIAIEVGLVFIITFDALPQKIACIASIHKNQFTGNILSELHQRLQAIKKEWEKIQSHWPEVYSSIQTKHAIQNIIHHETNDILELFNGGVLDESEKNRMTKLLSQTQHNVYFASFYYVTSIYGTNLSYRTTLLSLSFMTKMRHNKNEDLFANDMEAFFDEIVLKEYDEGSHIIKKMDNVTAYGIYVIVSGRCSLLDCGPLNHDEDYQLDDDGDDDRYELDVSRGGIVGGFEYLAGMPYLNEVIAKTHVMAYFINDESLEKLLNEERESYVCLWKQCAALLILSTYTKNDRSFLNQPSDRQIHRMCQNAKFVSFDSVDVNKRRLSLQSYDKMALVLLGKCRYEIVSDAGDDDDAKHVQEFNKTEFLWYHPSPYIFERYSKILILTIPKHNLPTALRQRSASHILRT